MFKKEFSVKSHGKTPTYINITDMVNEAIKESQINDGLVIVLTKHTTCSVFYEEFTHDFDERGNEFLQNDLDTVLEKIIPNHNSATTYSYPGPEHYKDVPNGDRSALWNGDAHLKATILGNSVTLDVENNKLAVGKTGYVYFVDFDRTRERTRKFSVIVIK